MDQKIIYDFDPVISRAGTFAEKYDARKSFFGKDDVEPFWVADMDLPTPAFLVDRLHERVNHAMFGYTEQYEELFQSIIWWMMDQHNVAVDPAWISLSPSVVTSISFAIQTYTEIGDTVALLSPVYGPFFTCTTQNKRRVSDCPLQVVEGQFQIDYAALEKQLADPSVKLMLLCNPHNPGGRVWSQEELQRLAVLCNENQVALFSDEIHCDIVYPPSIHQSMLNINGARHNSIMAHSIGKTFNCSGLQASFTIIPDESLRNSFRKTAEEAHAGDVNLLGKTALTHAFSPEGAEYKRQLTAYLHENTQQVCKLLQKLDKVKVMQPEATFLVWSDFRKFGPWQEVFNTLIHTANVALSGGRFFGPAGEGWFRINCGHPRSKLIPAVERIVSTLAE